MRTTGRPRKNREKNRAAMIACRLPYGTKDALYAEADKQERTVTDVMNDAFCQYLRRRGHPQHELNRIEHEAPK